MNFDEMIERRGTHSKKWDVMEKAYGVSNQDGLPMWIADMDFRPPQAVLDALEAANSHGVYGYYGDEASYLEAICQWMQARHGWHVAPEWIFTTHGLVNGTAMCVDSFTAPGDGIVLFTPVYHAFARVINAAGRRVVECPLVERDGRYGFDFAVYDAQMTGEERMVILCSPHNPGGTVWTKEELAALAAFAERHDLILVSDEIHHDLVMPSARHTPMAVAAPEIASRLVMMTAATKSFNIAGCHSGNVIISDAALRSRFAQRMAALGLSPNSFGLIMTEAAYRSGAAWMDAAVAYINENRMVFDAGIAKIPGVRSMPLEATYLAWVDFSGTGMPMSEVIDRVQNHAKIAANHGETFGQGGGCFLRFNIACPRAMVEDAITRLQAAFADLQ